MAECPAYALRFEAAYRNDHGSGRISLGPFEKRNRFLIGVLVRISEYFNRVGRHAQLQKYLAIGLSVAGLDADRNRPPIGDLRHQNLFDKALMIKLGGRKGPNKSPPPL